MSEYRAESVEDLVCPASGPGRGTRGAGGIGRAVARGAAILGLCVGLQACATVRPSASADLGLLTIALTEPVESLRDRAGAGEAKAQYAMALLYVHGLRGVARDPVEAALLRKKALGARGYTPITTYIAGLHGKPGRVAIINVPRYELDAGGVSRIDQCVAVLARGGHDPAGVDACAGPEAFERLDTLWTQAKRER